MLQVVNAIYIALGTWFVDHKIQISEVIGKIDILKEKFTEQHVEPIHDSGKGRGKHNKSDLWVIDVDTAKAALQVDGICTSCSEIDSK